MKLFDDLTNDNRYVVRYSAAFFFLLLSISGGFAQSRAAETNTVAGNEEVRGTVKFPLGVTSRSATVILRSLSSPEVRSMTDQDGNFVFTHLRPDSYTIIVDGGDTYEKASETIFGWLFGARSCPGQSFLICVPAVYQVRIYLQPKGLGSAAARPATAEQRSRGSRKRISSKLLKISVPADTFARSRI
jgi:hypothetical protein